MHSPLFFVWNGWVFGRKHSTLPSPVFHYRRNGSGDFLHHGRSQASDVTDEALRINAAQLQHIGGRFLVQSIEAVWNNPHVPKTASKGGLPAGDRRDELERQLTHRVRTHDDDRPLFLDLSAARWVEINQPDFPTFWGVGTNTR